MRPESTCENALLLGQDGGYWPHSYSPFFPGCFIFLWNCLHRSLWYSAFHFFSGACSPAISITFFISCGLKMNLEASPTKRNSILVARRKCFGSTRVKE